MLRCMRPIPEGASIAGMEGVKEMREEEAGWARWRRRRRCCGVGRWVSRSESAVTSCLASCKMAGSGSLYGWRRR